MSRLCRALLAVAITAAVTAPSAAVASERELSTTLGALWTTVIETPAANNPFTGGDPCIELGASVLAPFAGPPQFTCTVKAGTRIFVVGWSSECSTIEGPPYHGDDEASLRDCARAVDAALTTPTVSLDGSPVAVTEVETALLQFVLPAGHIFDPALAPGTPGQSVGHGWVALLHPLTPGSHVIRIEVHGTYLGAPLDSINTTTIQVRPGA